MLHLVLVSLTPDRRLTIPIPLQTIPEHSTTRFSTHSTQNIQRINTLTVATLFENHHSCENGRPLKWQPVCSGHSGPFLRPNLAHNPIRVIFSARAPPLHVRVPPYRVRHFTGSVVCIFLSPVVVAAAVVVVALLISCY
jgi:hypothetical protein